MLNYQGVFYFPSQRCWIEKTTFGGESSENLDFRAMLDYQRVYGEKPFFSSF
jgi:hypothetical protein